MGRLSARPLPVAAALICAVFAAFGVARACRDPVASCNADKDYFTDNKPVFAYSHGTFSPPVYHNTYVELAVTTDTGASYPVRMVRCGCESVVSSSAPAPAKGAQVFSVPPSAVYVGDTVIAAMLLTDFKVADQLKAFSDANYSYSAEVKSLIKEGKAQSVLNITEVAGTPLDNQLDLAIVGSYDVDTYIAASLKAPFFVSAEALESTPLRRFEWIKLFGLIFLNVPAVTTTFQQTEQQYNATRERAFTVLSVPSVVLNVPTTFKGVTSWSQPGGATYTAQLLRDANVDYRFSNNGFNTSDPLTLPNITKSFSSASHWVNMGLFPSSANLTMQALLDNKSPPLPVPFAAKTEETFKSLAAVKCGKAWAQTKRVTADGNANDYFEMGAIRPDLLLADLIKIFHPNVQTSADLTFYYNIGNPARGQAAACPYNQLPSQPPKDRAYIESSYGITGADRFAVEDNIERYVAPACANASNVGTKDVQLYFGQQANMSARPPASILNLTTSVAKGDEKQFDAAKVASAIQSSLIAAGVTGASGISVRVLTRGQSRKRKLSGGAIAGIVLGSLAFILLLALLGFCLFTMCFSRRRSAPPAPSGPPTTKKESAEPGANTGVDIEAGSLPQ
jgi:iron complex transport system substrate-binding protein